MRRSTLFSGGIGILLLAGGLRRLRASGDVEPEQEPQPPQAEPVSSEGAGDAQAATPVPAPASGPLIVLAVPEQISAGPDSVMTLGYLFQDVSGAGARIIGWQWSYRSADESVRYAEAAGPQYTNAGPAIAANGERAWSQQLLMDGEIVSRARARGDATVVIVTGLLGADAGGTQFWLEARHNAELL